MHQFLITSIGRTGTKWLAEVLGVPHEPPDFPGQAVSPRHLFLMVAHGWNPPVGTDVLVMIRNPREQLLSIHNRALTLGAGKMEIFQRHYRQYLAKLNGFVRQGSRVLVYEDLVGNEEAVKALAYDLGIEKVNEERIDQVYNQFPTHTNSFPKELIAPARAMTAHYAAWAMGRAIDPQSETRHQIHYDGRSYEMDYVFPAEIASLRAHKTGQFQELPVLEWVAKQRLAGTYIDCGAHVGNHSVFFLNHTKATKVVAIEAHPTIYKLLVNNLARSTPKGFDTINRAAWEVTGERVGLAEIPHNNAGHTHIVNTGGRSGEKAQVQVETVALDDCIEHGDVAVLKIDVEDVEEQVIKGATSILTHSHPIIIAERHSKEQLRAFEALIKPFGYQRKAEWSGIHTFAWV